MNKKSMISIKDYSQNEILHFIDLAHKLKKEKKDGKIGNRLQGKKIALIFEKQSLRTISSFEIAILEEGGHPIVLDNYAIGKKESIEDVAMVLGKMYDGIVYRGYEQQVPEMLAKFSGISVINALTDIEHPTEVIADFMTIEEHIHKPLNKIKIVFVGDIRNNICYSLMYGAAKLGMHFVCLGPKQLTMSQSILNYCQDEAKRNGGIIEVLDNIDVAVENADVIYTDVWISMGEDASLYKIRSEMLKPYKVTKDMMKKTKKSNTLFMHCLPSFHNFETKIASDNKENGIDICEVEDEVFKSKNSVVFDLVENRVNAIKAVMIELMQMN